MTFERPQEGKGLMVAAPKDVKGTVEKELGKVTGLWPQPLGEASQGQGRMLLTASPAEMFLKELQFFRERGVQEPLKLWPWQRVWLWTMTAVSMPESWRGAVVDQGSFS
jgi:hypothetical protein